MSLLRRIENAMDQRLRAIFSGGSDEPGAREAIELYREALDNIAARVTAGQRSERLFPFNAITIELMAAGGERKAVLAAVFDTKQLVTDIRAMLLEERVVSPAELAVTVQYSAEAVVDLRVFCERTDKTAELAVGVKAALLSTPKLEFVLDQLVVNLGRYQEVVDSKGRVIRRNDLFFPEAEFEASGTVSRAHAHIRFDNATGDWRIFDDGSSLGTSVFREGNRIEVPRHAGRGVALREGDEINLGQVRLLFAFRR